MMTDAIRTPGFRLLLGALLFGVSACGDDSGPVDPEDLVFAASLGVNLASMTRSSTGLYHQDQVVGTGALANAGASVTVDYTGWLHDGTQFDTSAGSGPIPVTLGNRDVIQGWEEGLLGMRAGGRRLLVIPSQLGYGARGAGGVIPPHATLVFRVDMRRVVPR
ncbi:MAG: FKBP-type peptidyl-prolyl cis-trans isomerase [Longimicrobiales bacterium]